MPVRQTLTRGPAPHVRAATHYRPGSPGPTFRRSWRFAATCSCRRRASRSKLLWDAPLPSRGLPSPSLAPRTAPARRCRCPARATPRPALAGYARVSVQALQRHQAEHVPARRRVAQRNEFRPAGAMGRHLVASCRSSLRPSRIRMTAHRLYPIGPLGSPEGQAGHVSATRFAAGDTFLPSIPASP